MLLVRHASAGLRASWDGDDRLRPLDERGHRQALDLVEALDGYPIERILSSPYLRCILTVEPLAAARGLAIEPREELSEQRQAGDALPLIRSLSGGPAALCTHGGIEQLIGSSARYRKGEALVLGPRLEVVRSIPPAS
jgi:8-oxo-dGTP diphosphatase